MVVAQSKVGLGVDAGSSSGFLRQDHKNINCIMSQECHFNDIIISPTDLAIRLVSPTVSIPSPYLRRMVRYFLSWIVPSISRMTCVAVGDRSVVRCEALII